MKKRFFSKILIVILLIIMVINNVSYAIDVDKNKLEKSLLHMFGSDVRIDTEVAKNGITGSSSLTYSAPSELEMKENQIILREVGEVDGQRAEVSLLIDYSIDEENANFKMKTDIKEYLKYEPEDEYVLSLIGLMMMHSNCMSMGYLAIAESLNIDLNTAATYFEQCMPYGFIDEEEYDPNVVSCDLFTRKMKFDETNQILEISIEIDLEKLSKINNSLLDGTVKSTIEFLEENKSQVITKNENENQPTNNTNSNKDVNNTVNNETDKTTNNTMNNIVNNTTNNTTNNLVNNIANNTVNNIANNVVNNTANKENNVTNNQTVKPADNTTSNKIIPAAGSETIACIVFGLAVISTLFYIKLRKYDDVI